MRKRIYRVVLLATVLLGLLPMIGVAASRAATGPDLGPCSVISCQKLLPAATHDGWVSPYRLREDLSVSVNVESSRGKVPLRGLERGGCVAQFSGAGVRMRVAICDPGASRVRITYTAPHTEVSVFILVHE
jgi:hypothetical protein